MNATYNTYREIVILNNKKRRLEIVRNQRIAVALAVAVVLFIATFTGASLMLKASSGEDLTYKYYTSVTVNSGDTLSSIASEYMTDEYADASEYIKEVKSINHIEDGNDIVAGENIVVPYYAAEFKD